MRYRIVMGVVALAACLPALAVAQEQPAAATTPVALLHRDGGWELSVGGGGTYLDRALAGRIQVTNAVVSRLALGGVVRIAYHFDANWGLSAGTGIGSTSPATVIQPFVALTWTPNLDARTSPFLLAGVGGSFTRWTDSGCTGQSCRITGLGGHLGVGIVQSLSERLALRVEAREQYERYDQASIPNAVFNTIGTVGLSWFFGGGRPKDSDGDGVPDKYDRCPNTPPGAIVDARGCPIDSDQDGVPDGLDKCPNTPAGVQVDASGCPVDSDGDGVPDYLDRCVNTPSGVQVDANGCPVDGDNDGVADYLDKCPNTPADARPVDANGCPVDSDNDGIPDYLDRCPNTPADARPVDATGCPVDSDNDGVADYLDRCPNTPAGTPVDASGCPVVAARPRPQVRVDTTTQAAPLLAVNASLVLRNVVFHPNSARLPPEAPTDLDAVAVAMRAIPNARWEISGHTSSMGNAAQNLRLSQRRALVVKAYLVRQGVPAASLTSVGYGGEHPLTTNSTVAGRRQNMRVEIKRLR